MIEFGNLSLGFKARTGSAGRKDRERIKMYFLINQAAFGSLDR